MLIITTGASGCLGRAFVDAAVKRDHDVVALVRSDHSEPPAPHPRLRTVTMDLARPLDRERMPAAPDGIVHLAQSRRHRQFPEAAKDIFDVNTWATFALAEYGARVGVQRFVFTSTGSVYRPQARACKEGDETSNATFYNASKLAGESLLAPFGEIFDVFIPRLFYLYGPGQKDMLISRLASRVEKGEPVTLQGEGGITITPTLARDAAEILLTGLEEGWSGIFNVAAPEHVSLEKLAREIGAVVGKAPRFEIGQGADDHPRPPIPCLDKLSAKVDLERIVTPLGDGLRHTFSA